MCDLQKTLVVEVVISLSIGIILTGSRSEVYWLFNTLNTLVFFFFLFLIAFFSVFILRHTLTLQSKELIHVCLITFGASEAIKCLNVCVCVCAFWVSFTANSFMLSPLCLRSCSFLSLPLFLSNEVVHYFMSPSASESFILHAALLTSICFFRHLPHFVKLHCIHVFFLCYFTLPTCPSTTPHILWWFPQSSSTSLHWWL